MASINVLVIGDIVGEPGRRVCKELIPFLQKEEHIHFIIANGENSAGGSGITLRTAEELFQSGIDVITSGDHIFKQKEVFDVFKNTKRLLRPANYPRTSNGTGGYVYKINDGVSIGVVNLLGRVFLTPADCPFQRIVELIEELKTRTNIIIVDFHAEATSEKVALGWYLDGKVSAVCGTHTHIQTADETILPHGTAYITDVGMTGPFKSVLGRDIDAVINKFVTQMPTRFNVAQDDLRMNAVVITIDTDTGLATAIKRIQKKFL